MRACKIYKTNRNGIVWKEIRKHFVELVKKKDEPFDDVWMWQDVTSLPSEPMFLPLLAASSKLKFALHSSIRIQHVSVKLRNWEEPRCCPLKLSNAIMVTWCHMSNCKSGINSRCPRSGLLLSTKCFSHAKQPVVSWWKFWLKTSSHQSQLLTNWENHVNESGMAVLNMSCPCHPDLRTEPSASKTSENETDEGFSPMHVILVTRKRPGSNLEVALLWNWTSLDSLWFIYHHWTMAIDLQSRLAKHNRNHAIRWRDSSLKSECWVHWLKATYQWRISAFALLHVVLKSSEPSCNWGTRCNIANTCIR